MISLGIHANKTSLRSFFEDPSRDGRSVLFGCAKSQLQVQNGDPDA